MDKQKQIEKMAEDLRLVHRGKGFLNYHQIAEGMIGLNYHKIPEDKVVLTREEYEKHIESAAECGIKIGKIIARNVYMSEEKDAVKEFAENIGEICK